MLQERLNEILLVQFPSNFHIGLVENQKSTCLFSFCPQTQLAQEDFSSRELSLGARKFGMLPEVTQSSPEYCLIILKYVLIVLILNYFLIMLVTTYLL